MRSEKKEDLSFHAAELGKVPILGGRSSFLHLVHRRKDRDLFGGQCLLLLVDVWPMSVVAGDLSWNNRNRAAAS
jgi:hypothetical protein